MLYCVEERNFKMDISCYLPFFKALAMKKIPEKRISANPKCILVL